MSTISIEDLKRDELSPGEQLYRISQKTNDDGTVNVDISDWEKLGDNVAVEFITPSADTEREVMEWPTRDDPNEYKFAALCREYGSGIVDPDGLIGVEVPADDEDWSLQVDYSPPRRTRIARGVMKFFGELKRRLFDFPEISVTDVLDFVAIVGLATLFVGIVMLIIGLIGFYGFGFSSSIPILGIVSIAFGSVLFFLFIQD